MTNKYKKSGSFDKEYFVKPRIVFDEAFEKQVAAGIPSTRLGKYLEKLKAGRYGKYAGFVLNHKYAFSYGIVGILIFGFIIGLICAGFGWFVDRALDRRMAFNQEMSEKNEQYKKYRHSFFMRDYRGLIWQTFSYAMIGFVLYIGLIAISDSIQLLNPFLKSWYKFTDPLTLKMALFIPAIDNYGQYLSHAGSYKLIWQVRHLMATSWFMTILSLPVFAVYCLGLIRRFHFLSYNITKIEIIKQAYALIVSLIIFYLSFNIFFLANKFNFFAEAPFLASAGPVICVAMFMAFIITCIELGTIIKINK